MKNIRNFIVALLLWVGVVGQSFGQTDPQSKLNLILVAPETQVSVNDEIEVQLMVAAESAPQRYLVADIIIGWNPAELQLLGVSHEGSHPLLWPTISGFPITSQDYTGINETIPPADGNALYYGYGELGQVWIVTEPVQICKFKFKVLKAFTESPVTLLPELEATYPADTVIYGSFIGGWRVTGTLYSTTVTGRAILGDFDGNGRVEPADMAQLLANWGQISYGTNPLDLDGNGQVGAGDLSILISNWS
jgi:hypothetical protein